MKKYLISLFTVLLVLASCTKFETDKSDPVIACGKPEITLVAPVGGTASDSAFTATITPPSETSFYSYLVTKGEAIDETINATTLLKVGYTGVAQGTVDAAKTAVLTLNMTKLEPNTKYQVYAVAANGQGTIGAVSSAEILTTDQLTPKPMEVSVSAAKLSAVFTFNENLVRGASTKKAYATYYKVNNPNDSTIVNIPEKNIVISGNTLTLTATDTIPGAWVIITFDEGLVRNEVGTNGLGYKVQAYNASDPSKSKGIKFRIDNKPFDLSLLIEDDETGDLIEFPSDTLIYFSSDNEATFGLTVGYKSRIYISNKIDAKVSYIVEGRTTIVDIPDDGIERVSPMLVKLYLPEFCDENTIIDFSVAEASFQDEWGNTSNAVATNKNFKKLFISNGLLSGIYSATAASYLESRGTFTWNIRIFENSDGTYTISNFEPYFAKYEFAADLVATYDEVEGIVSIAGGQPVATGDYSNVFLWGADAATINESNNLSTEYPVEMEMLENGWLKVLNAFGVTDDPAGGWWNLMDGGFTFVKFSNDPNASPIPTAFPQFPASHQKLMK